MSNNMDDYENSKQAVGDWLSGGGGTYVRIAAGLLIAVFIITAIVTAF